MYYVGECVRNYLLNKDCKKVERLYPINKEVLKRKGLTINSICRDMNNHHLIDFFDGVKDLLNKELRYIDYNTFIQKPSLIYEVARLVSTDNFKISKELKVALEVMNKKVTDDVILGNTNRAIVESENPFEYFVTLYFILGEKIFEDIFKFSYTSICFDRYDLELTLKTFKGLNNKKNKLFFIYQVLYRHNGELLNFLTNRMKKKLRGRNYEITNWKQEIFKQWT